MNLTFLHNVHPLAPVMCHLSHVTCHMSDIYFFFLKSGEASQGRACYQRGLPRLVLSYFDHPAPYCPFRMSQCNLDIYGHRPYQYVWFLSIGTYKYKYLFQLWICLKVQRKLDGVGFVDNRPSTD